MIGRLVPVGPDWLISGNFVCYPKSDRVAIHCTACEMAMGHPNWAFRNPDKLARARQQQSAEHDRFVQFFGADFLVIPGAQLTERLRSFYTFCRDQVVAELAASGKRPKHPPFHGPDYPSDLVASDSVAVTHDEVEGLRLYAEFGMIEETFAGPSLLRHPDIADERATTSRIPPFRPSCSSGWPCATPSVRSRCSVNCWGEATSTGLSVARS
jgi:hypothetical protein